MADYLLYLDGDDKAYKKYLEWRLEYVEQYTRAWDRCQFCEDLHNIQGK